MKKQKGFFCIPNHISEALAKYALNGAERRVLDVVMRQTWGWEDKGKKGSQKEWDHISISQFIAKTGLAKSAISAALTSLCLNRVLDKVSGSINRYKINTDSDVWVSLKEGRGSRKRSSPSLDSGIDDVLGSGNTINTITKENSTISSATPPDTTNPGTSPSMVGEGAPTPSPVWLQGVEFQKLAHAKNRVHRIAGYLLLRRGYEYQNKEQFVAAFKRALKPAKALEPYDKLQIDAAIEYTIRQSEELGFAWTLETVVKNIEKAANS